MGKVHYRGRIDGKLGSGGGIKDDCANLQLKGGKIWTDRESVD